jgi:hypothetical protein
MGSIMAGNILAEQLLGFQGPFLVISPEAMQPRTLITFFIFFFAQIYQLTLS